MKICRKLASPAAALLAAAVLSTPALALSGTGTTSALQSTQTAVLTAADQAVSQED